MTRKQVDDLYKLTMDIGGIPGIDVFINYFGQSRVLDIWVYPEGFKVDSNVAHGQMFHTENPIDVAKYEGFIQTLEQIKKSKVARVKNRLKEFAVVKFRNNTSAILLKKEEHEGNFYSKRNLLENLFCEKRMENYNERLEHIAFPQSIEHDIIAFKNFTDYHEAITTLLQHRPIKWEWSSIEQKEITNEGAAE
jgi:hypothetical protein